VLVVPYRIGDVQLADRYELLLTRSRGVRMVDLTRDQLRAAAQLRAMTGAKTPDALQLAAALSTGCRTFVTNDRDLPAVPGLQIIQLSSYLKRK
jgi:predicted nucleic acid-binding protein